MANNNRVAAGGDGFTNCESLVTFAAVDAQGVIAPDIAVFDRDRCGAIADIEIVGITASHAIQSNIAHLDGVDRDNIVTCQCGYADAFGSAGSHIDKLATHADQGAFGQEDVVRAGS